MGKEVRLSKEKIEELKAKQKKRNGYTSILLALFALVAVTAATVAWFSIADRTRLQSIDIEVTSGISLKFDLDPHESFDDYIKTLTFNQIADRVKADQGYDIREGKLEPVTTSDAVKFTYEDGRVVPSDSGAYMSFTLHFMASKDMLVHLTSANSSSGIQGTNVDSKNQKLPDAMRISFACDGETSVFDPGMASESVKSGKIKHFGLPDGDKMVYNNDNALFYLKAGENKPVEVRIWLEGTDENCTDDVRKADYSIRLRFVGTDKDSNTLLDDDAN